MYSSRKAKQKGRLGTFAQRVTRSIVINRFRFKIPFVAKAEAEGLAGIIALVIVVLVAVFAVHWLG
jgi:hypothetical protein